MEATFSAQLSNNLLKMARCGLFCMYEGRHIMCLFCGLKVPVFGERPECVDTGGNINDDAAEILRQTLLRLTMSSTHLNVRIRQPGSTLAELNVNVRPLLNY